MTAEQLWAAMVGMVLGASAVHLVPSSAVALVAAGVIVAALLYVRAWWSRRA